MKKLKWRIINKSNTCSTLVLSPFRCNNFKVSYLFTKKRTFCITKLCKKKHFSQNFNIFFFPLISFTLVTIFNTSCTLLWPFYPSKKGKSKATPPKRNKVLHSGNLSQAKVEPNVLTFQNTLDKLRKALSNLPLKLKVFPNCSIHHTSNQQFWLVHFARCNPKQNKIRPEQWVISHKIG